MHITLVWQQCIIRLHVIYKIIAAVQKYSQQENFRSPLRHRYTDMHIHTDCEYPTKITQEERKIEGSSFYWLGISSVPCQHALSVSTELRVPPFKKRKKPGEDLIRGKQHFGMK